MRSAVVTPIRNASNASASCRSRNHRGGYSTSRVRRNVVANAKRLRTPRQRSPLQQKQNHVGAMKILRSRVVCSAYAPVEQRVRCAEGRANIRCTSPTSCKQQDVSQRADRVSVEVGYAYYWKASSGKRRRNVNTTNVNDQHGRDSDSVECSSTPYRRVMSRPSENGRRGNQASNRHREQCSNEWKVLF